MYDTLSLWLPLTKQDCSLAFSELPLKLNHFKETFDHSNNTTTISGSLNSIYFNIRETGIFITGSLCKYHFGNNQKTLTIQDTKTAIESLTAFTGYPIYDASVYRIDFSENYILSQPEYLYYDYLGSSTYYKRLEQNNGLYYNNQRRQLVFYGKVYEQKLKKQVILPIFEGKNVLRYEMRLKRKIPFQIGLPKIKAHMLYEPVLYKKLLEKYRSEYLSISKKHNLILNNNIIAEKNGLWNQLLLLGAHEMGGEEELLKLINNAKKEMRFSNPMQVQRLKEKIKSIFRTSLLTKPSDLIIELDEKILEKVRVELMSIS